MIATKNQGKVREFASLLAGSRLILRGLNEFAPVEEVAETGATFAENARLKAVGYAAVTGCLTLADDSGLEVDALNKAPGIHSARFGGAGATDADRIELLLNALSAFPSREQRRARFVCVIALHDPQANETYTFEGMCEGSIAHAPQGAHGFGYDPIFVPEEFDKTFGELPAEIKARISHRARAARATCDFLRDYLRQPRA